MHANLCARARARAQWPVACGRGGPACSRTRAAYFERGKASVFASMPRAPASAYAVAKKAAAMIGITTRNIENMCSGSAFPICLLLTWRPLPQSTVAPISAATAPISAARADLGAVCSQPSRDRIRPATRSAGLLPAVLRAGEPVRVCRALGVGEAERWTGDARRAARPACTQRSASRWSGSMCWSFPPSS